jgi:penicillin-binding protein 1A
VSEKRKKLLKNLLKLAGLGFIAGVILVISVIVYFAKDLPNFNNISDYKPNLITKIYSEDNKLVSEYAQEKRIYVKLDDIPQKIVKSLLATEDSGFYEHNGFDIKGIFRAAIKNILFGSREGASTITQQLVKNLLLTNERTYSRKIKEIILSYRIERRFTKDEILELYLNHIYLGARSYGIMQAALTYFNTDLDSLTNAQIALLVGLPKAPNGYNPLKKPKVARFRRDVVLGRMLAENIITQDEYNIAVNSDLELNPRKSYYGQSAPDYSEHVRRLLENKYGKDGLYTSGLQVNTTLDLNLQKIAQQSVINGVKGYDKRHGYRGPIAKLSLLNTWDSKVKQLENTHSKYKIIGDFAYVAQVNDDEKNAQIILEDGSLGIIKLNDLKWARKYISVNEKGPVIHKISDVLNVSDIILVNKLAKQPKSYMDKKTIQEDGVSKEVEEEVTPLREYSLEQYPEIQTALIAIDVKTGAVKALVGGFDKQGTFNRAIQAKRQVGSSFKPFVYGTALEKGFQTNSIILDAPIILRDSELNKAWKPQNYSEKVYGPSTLRRGIEHSRNLMTIRLARKVGISNIIKFASRLGLPTENMEKNLSTALGSASISLIDMVAAYTVFANKGIYNNPYFIESIQDRSGSVIYKQGFDCNDCHDQIATETTLPAQIEKFEAPGQPVISDSLAYMITDLLQGVVKRGTGWRAKSVGIPVAAKTGTTNEYIDAWFVGYSADLAVGVWSGFDNPQTMGNQETGSGVSGPVWSEFMKEAKKYLPNSSFEIPDDIVFAKVDEKTGQLPTNKTTKTILDVFVNGTEPNSNNNFTESSEEDDLLEGIY